MKARLVKNVDSVFSVEMKSKKHVKRVSISDETHDRVLFEGNLGELLEVFLVEGDVLELVGVNGILRVGLTKEQLQGTIRKESQVEPCVRCGGQGRIEKGGIE